MSLSVRVLGAALKQIEYLVADSRRMSSPISTAVALARRGCGPRSPRPPDRSAPSTARRCARARRRCGRRDLAAAISLKEKNYYRARR